MASKQRARSRTQIGEDAQLSAAGERSITTALPRLLAAVASPGDFYATGAAELPVVTLSVDRVGLLGLPISAQLAEALVAVATPAPYGRGGRPIVDPAVRRCHQIDASAIGAGDARWKRALGRVVDEAGRALGVAGAIAAALYKMLIYEDGGFFLEHRDTEKVAGMFGTLVVVLPSRHRGGELVVTHAGRRVRIDLASDDLGAVRWAAFYSDCAHELEPVTDGWRVALVYNLVRAKGDVPRPPDNHASIEAVVRALTSWAARKDAPPKLVLPLAHHYTPAELAFATLKNEDRAAADVMRAAAPLAACTLRLAMVSIVESGMAEATGGSDGWGYDDDEDYDVEDDDDDVEFAVVETFGRRKAIDDWRDLDDQRDWRGAIDFDESELAPPGALDGEEPDEQHFHEASGNEGASYDRTYRRAALVVWPDAREPEVIVQGGAEVVVATLERWLDDATKDEASVRLAALMVAAWPRTTEEYAGLVAVTRRMLSVLKRIAGAAPLESYVNKVVAAGAFDDALRGDVVALLAMRDDDGLRRVLERLVKSCARLRLDMVGAVVRAAIAARPAVLRRAVLASLIASLPAALSDDAAHERLDVAAYQDELELDEEDDRSDADDDHPSARVFVARSPADVVAGLTDVLASVAELGDAALGGRVASAFTAARALDDVALPALLGVIAEGVPIAPLAALSDACRAHLEARTARAPVPFPDMRRANAGVGCGCADCRALTTFLADPIAAAWRLKAEERRRRHVQYVVDRAGCDLALTIDKRGRPYQLVCTKTDASYRAELTRHEADRDALARLVKAVSGHATSGRA